MPDGSNKPESIPFLKSLNTINGTSVKLLINQLITILKSSSYKNFDRELVYKLLALLAINGDEHMAVLVMSELLVISTNHFKLINRTNGREETMLIQIRQEISPFHVKCLCESVNSIVKSFEYEKNDEKLSNFLQNLTAIYDWDIQNPSYMRFCELFDLFIFKSKEINLTYIFFCFSSQNLSSILIERECFIGLIKQLEFNETYDFSLQILQLYNRILTLHPEYPDYLKLNVSDLIICGNKLIDFFYKLTTSKSGKIILTSYFLNLIFKMNLILRAVNSKRKIYKFGFNFYKFIQEQYKKNSFS